MMKLSLCVLFILTELYTVQASSSSFQAYTKATTAARPGPTTTAKRGHYTTAGPGGAGGGNCAKCPACPAGYSEPSLSGCNTNCLCQWQGWPSATTGKPSSLLIKILANIGSNADSISQMAASLKEELQVAQGLA